MGAELADDPPLFNITAMVNARTDIIMPTIKT
jgi:hypothetical protein